MRKPVPMLDSHLSGDEFLKLIVDSFQSVVFGTVDQNGDPHTNVADIEVLDGNRLIFATTYQKPFYQRLKAHPRISITALKGSETQQYLEQIFDARPEMQQISSNHSERRSILRPFAIAPIAGSIYDLRQQPIFQKRIEF